MIASQRQPCLPGTRKQLLAEIINWATQGDLKTVEKNVLWLHGMAGSGKSTIATTVAHYFGTLERQGAYLFFERATSKPDSAIRTLAYKLARFDENIDSAVNAAVNANQSIVDLPLKEQFTRLLRVPLASVADKLTGPIIVVLDALDECGDPNSRAGLLDILANHLSSLPPVFRFLITSRPERDIYARFSTSNLVMSLESMVSKEDAISDIEAYITLHMEDVRKGFGESFTESWPTKKQIQSLARNSEGLFIWASTACNLIARAASPRARMHLVLSPSKEGKGVVGLDDLYAVALQSSCPWENTDLESWNYFKFVMVPVLFCRVNVDDGMIDRLLGQRVPDPSRLILSNLSCLLDYADSQPVRPLHASFRDYLTDKNCSEGKPWSLTSIDPEYLLAECCFRIMENQLHFNICGIAPSDQWDRYCFTGSNSKNAISQELKYACQYWAGHLLATQRLDDSIMTLLHNFSYSQFLFWAEVMQVYGLRYATSNACEAVANFIKVSSVLSLQSCI